MKTRQARDGDVSSTVTRGKRHLLVRMMRPFFVQRSFFVEKHTKVCERVNLIGCDVNELCPPCDPTGASTAVAYKIIREMLIAIVNRKD